MGATRPKPRKNPSGGRTYGQSCGLAYALDLVGERWTLLLVRELAYGQKRFAHLLEAMPGIGTNLLAKRLKELEAAGVIQKAQLPPPASVQVYELTELGGELREIVAALQRWGLRAVPDGKSGGFALARWAAQASIGVIPPERLAGLDFRVAFDLGSESSYLEIQDGRARAHSGLPRDADVTLRMDQDTYFELASGKRDLVSAERAGKVMLEGKAAARQLVMSLLGRRTP